MKNVLALHLELCFAVSIILAVVWSPGPTTIHRPWPNHMVFFVPYLNVLLWIMLAAPIAFFFYSRRVNWMQLLCDHF